jgi:FKBP-type peptidyl-prolyl cis-trans isomerase
MDPKQIKQILIPATALAAVVIVAAIIFGAFDTGQKQITSSATADSSSAGMSDKMPSSEGPEWKLVHSGLKILDVKEGTGEPVAKGQSVRMHYTGWRANDGFEFDSSRKATPLESTLKSGRGGLIQGWVDGVPGMKVGGIRRIFIPAALGYGERGQGNDIPPNTDLIFEVKLIAFQ